MTHLGNFKVEAFAKSMSGLQIGRSQVNDSDEGNDNETGSDDKNKVRTGVTRRGMQAAEDEIDPKSSL